MTLSLKKIVSVFLLISVFLTFSVFASAENDEKVAEPLRYTTISTINSVISKSGVTVTCNSDLSAKYSTNLKITMVLQKSSSGSWTDVKTWTKTGSGTYLSAEESKVINIFSTYRLKVTFTAGSESVTAYAYY